jgi:hypothetical protein
MFGNFPSRTSAHDFNVSFQIPYIPDCKKREEVIRNYEHENIPKFSIGEAR